MFSTCCHGSLVVIAPDSHARVIGVVLSNQAQVRFISFFLLNNINNIFLSVNNINN